MDKIWTKFNIKCTACSLSCSARPQGKFGERNIYVLESSLQWKWSTEGNRIHSSAGRPDADWPSIRRQINVLRLLFEGLTLSISRKNCVILWWHATKMANRVIPPSYLPDDWTTKHQLRAKADWEIVLPRLLNRGMTLSRQQWPWNDSNQPGVCYTVWNDCYTSIYDYDEINLRKITCNNGTINHTRTECEPVVPMIVTDTNLTASCPRVTCGAGLLAYLS